MARGRRGPLTPPQLVQELRGGSLESLLESVRNALRKQSEWNHGLFDSFSGNPKEHADTHLVGHSDALATPGTPRTVLVGGNAQVGVGPSYLREDAQLVTATGTPSDLGDANAEGVSTSAPRLDHVHKRQIGVYKAGSLVGKRRDLNLVQGSNVTLTVTDNAGADRVDVTVASTGGGGGGMSAGEANAISMVWAMVLGNGM